MKSTFLDKLLGRIDRIDPASLQNYMQRIVREKGFLETIFNSLQEGVLVADNQGNITYLNRAAQELLGIPQEAPEGPLLQRYLPGVNWAQILKTKASGATGDSRIISKDVEVLYPKHRILNFYIMPLSAADSQFADSVIILRDQTESRKSTAETIESERLSAITLLAAGVAHEIGNPLNSLNIHMQLMERELNDLPPSKQKRFREYLQISREEVSRLDSIVTQFLRAVRPTQPNLVGADINEILVESIRFMKPEFHSHDIIVEQELSPDLPKIPCDAAQLKQVFYNVMKNAVQAMTRGGILRVKTDLTSGHVRITFRDTGGGIAPSDIPNIFQPYFTTKGKGSGLGLMIVQRIIREHGGLIEVDSDVGRGVTFKILLPIQDRRARMLPGGTDQAEGVQMKAEST